jgi:hypothetical protein
MIFIREAAHSSQAAKGSYQMLSANNLHFIDVVFPPPVFPPPMPLVGGVTRGMAAHITDMATASSGRPLVSCFSASAGRLPWRPEQDTAIWSSLASNKQHVMSVESTWRFDSKKLRGTIIFEG